MLIRNSFLALAVIVPASATALETTTVFDLVAGVVGVDGDGTGQLATAAAVLRQPTPYTARDAAPSPHKNADLGALALQQRSLTTCSHLCPDDSVRYCHGSAQGIVGYEGATCDGDCCTGDSACHGFTGCVKRDGSCSGPRACFNAAVAIIEDSCIGSYSCWYTSNGGGLSQTLTLNGSCKGTNACQVFGRYGSVGALTRSCNGEAACEYLAFEGTVGPITKSCNRNSACAYAVTSGSIKSITMTCNNDAHKPCQILNEGARDYGHLTKFIHAETGEKYNWDSIGSIGDCFAECANDDECNGIKWKEHSGMPCRFFGGEISENKCNGRNVCMSV